MTVWFDVEDLLHHWRGGHSHVTGIQRLTLEIYRAAQAIGGVGFVRHGTGLRRFVVVDWAELDGMFGETGPGRNHAATPAAGPPRPQAESAKAGPRRSPLFSASVMQAQAVIETGRFVAGVARHVGGAAARGVGFDARPGRREEAGPGPELFEQRARPGDTLLVLGSPWWRQNYSALARWLRDERRMRFGVLFHDLVPVRRPEWCDEGVRRTFRDWYTDVLPFCDCVLANSRYTAADAEAFAREQGVALPRPVRAVPIGSAGTVSSAAEPGNYVLFVSTLEVRKNHALLVQVWRRLLAEVHAGQRSAASVPDLVFAGRVGWLVADLVEQLDVTGWLGGRIRLAASPGDAELRALYAGALFTVFPSLFEGWGLPVTESLAAGVPCLSSNAASLPEAGGALCRYFDPNDAGSAYRAVAALLDDRPGLAAWRETVAREFRPTPWSETARAVLEEAGAT